MAGIGLVFNPRAGGLRRDPDAPRRLARRLGDNGVVAVPRSIDELLRAAEDFLRLRIDVLGIAGGDGTNHVTITGFHRVWQAHPLPTLAFLRGGTMNTVANSLRLPQGRPEGLLDRLVRRYLEHPLDSVRQHTMDIDGQLGFLWGLGVVPAFLQSYYDTGAPSPWTAVKTLARGIGSALVGGALVREWTRPIEAEVTTNAGDHWPEQPFFTIAAGTIPDIGLGFRPFHRAEQVPGTFHLLGIQTSPVGFVLDLPRIHRAQGMSPGKSRDVLAREATVRTRGPSLRYMIDGDVLESPRAEMTIRMGPEVRIATMQ